ncbi:MAG: class I SAM-dependent methyltransferase, partial [Planctomycetota bacterium]
MNRPSDDIRVWEQLRRTPQLLVELTSTDAPCAEHELRVQKRLRARYPPDLVRAAVELIQARQRARGKFSRADRMWFDRRGVEQATDELIARRKAERFAAHPEVVDLCCGVGGDTIALAQRTGVVAVDESPLA